jgi:RNA polymerase-binding transcription factor DksA
MSTAADILYSNRRPKIPAHWQPHHHHLCLERDRLMARDCSAPAISLAKLDDMGDAATEESDRCLSLVASTATQDLIFEVLAALRRLERGTYGICEITGKPIEPDRLEALPWARYSIEGQQDLEKNGLARKTIFPSLSPLSADTNTDETEDESD